ncbi:MAG: ABC transporter substrate-binding protein [Methyloligellaceae bacterium]
MMIRTMHRIGLFQTLAAIVACLAASVSPSGTAAADSKKVVFTTDWGYNGRHAYYFVALDKGYYKAEGLDVEILGGRGSGTVIKEVAAGTVKIGFADAGTLALARANENVPVKMLAVVYADSPHALIVLEESGIKGPKDLEGKTASDAAGSSNYKYFGAYAKAGGADPDKVKWVFSESTALVGLLLAGRVDAIGQYALGIPLLEKRAAPKKVGILLYKNVPGFQIYANGIIVREDTLKKEPDMVRKFVKASMKGLRDACADPAEAGKILAKYHKQVEPDIGEGETKLVCEIAINALSKKHGLGHIDLAKMGKTIDLVKKAFELKRKIDPSEVFVPGFTGKLE